MWQFLRYYNIICEAYCNQEGWGGDPLSELTRNTSELKQWQLNRQFSNWKFNFKYRLKWLNCIAIKWFCASNNGHRWKLNRCTALTQTNGCNCNWTQWLKVILASESAWYIEWKPMKTVQCNMRSTAHNRHYCHCIVCGLNWPSWLGPAGHLWTTHDNKQKHIAVHCWRTWHTNVHDTQMQLREIKCAHTAHVRTVNWLNPAAAQKHASQNG